jgi:hypothetical protein
MIHLHAFRGAWRFSRVLKRISWADKNNLTVPKIFDMYANKNPKKVCFYYEDEKWTFKQVQSVQTFERELVGINS